MLKGVKTISQSRECIGSIIRSTKINYTWKLLLNSEEVTIVLLEYKLTSKITLLLDSVVFFQGKIVEKHFSHDFRLKNYNLSIIKTNFGFDILINDLSFLVMHNRHASLLVPDSASQSVLIPMKKIQFEATTRQDMAEWEKSAKSYRLKFREIPEEILKEKIPIKPGLIVKPSRQHLNINEQGGKVNVKKNHASNSFAQTTKCSNNSEKAFSNDYSIQKRRNRNPASMNFFLL